MTVGLLQLLIRIPGSNSLKEKRRILHSLRDKLRKNYNISLAEIDEHDKWQRTVLAIAKVEKQRFMIDRSFNRVIEFIKDFNSVEIIDYQMEMF